ncbi:hypothetical protein BRAS3843_1380037 [Bradyrhizobium sp. STM 3843]|nr:hypothetical protein BRAS3843_1380037 [Bradyrhizobium sp. STM 3843]
MQALSWRGPTKKARAVWRTGLIKEILVI